MTVKHIKAEPTTPTLKGTSQYHSLLTKRRVHTRPKRRSAIQSRKTIQEALAPGGILDYAKSYRFTGYLLSFSSNCCLYLARPMLTSPLNPGHAYLPLLPMDDRHVDYLSACLTFSLIISRFVVATSYGLPLFSPVHISSGAGRTTADAKIWSLK
ncbi:hypothetical protein GALMADRAFT_146475 [Galerina marginata CBS 339.88]|uniref:Uncharacterized protein n=1 Tax=Galerina marginata (strain CBS 339.88) TaxID=685588 RepID=A0A067SBJ2_GALM3|nr:hypothetical protein GALMADRAFT_146475 [Galerina marginata CBS 339.88]